MTEHRAPTAPEAAYADLAYQLGTALSEATLLRYQLAAAQQTITRLTDSLGAGLEAQKKDPEPRPPEGAGPEVPQGGGATAPAS